jgi:hypothetical protein
MNGPVSEIALTWKEKEEKNPKHTCVLSIHEFEGFFLVTKAFTIIILTSCEVLTENLWIENSKSESAEQRTEMTFR